MFARTAPVTDTSTGRPVSDLRLTHSVFMHLIATRADLATFTHVHPEPTGTAGELAVEMTFPTPGRYILNTEFRRNGQLADVHDRQLVTIAGPATGHSRAAVHHRRRRPRRVARAGTGRHDQRPDIQPHRRTHGTAAARPCAPP